MRHNFCVFILSHGRADKVETIGLLERHGYHGEWRIVCDDGDATLPEYKRRFGSRVLVFNKAATGSDTCDTFADVNTILEARNVCFRLARENGFDYFCELDDDYHGFYYRKIKGRSLVGIQNHDFDGAFDALCDFIDCDERVLSISFSQGGDFIGGAEGYSPDKFYRKAMNSFVCRADRPFQFRGHFNEDVSTFVVLAREGYIFTQTPLCHINQHETQKNAGGITEAYLKYGTYTKSFMTVMQAPSCVCVRLLAGRSHSRMHHGIAPLLAYPKILSEKWRRT